MRANPATCPQSAARSGGAPHCRACPSVWEACQAIVGTASQLVCAACSASVSAAACLSASASDAVRTPSLKRTCLCTRCTRATFFAHLAVLFPRSCLADGRASHSVLSTQPKEPDDAYFRARRDEHRFRRFSSDKQPGRRLHRRVGAADACDPDCHQHELKTQGQNRSTAEGLLGLCVLRCADSVLSCTMPT